MALPAAALAVDMAAVVAGFGCHLVMPMTPCDGLAVGCATFADLVVLSGLTSLTGSVDLASDSTHDNCVVLPAAELAVDMVTVVTDLVMPITLWVELMSLFNVAGLSLCMVPNMSMSGTFGGCLTRCKRCQTPYKPNAYHTLQLTHRGAVALHAMCSKLFCFSDGCMSAVLSSDSRYRPP